MEKDVKEEMDELVEKVNKIVPPGWRAHWFLDHNHRDYVFLIANAGELVSVRLTDIEILVSKDHQIEQKISARLRELLGNKRIEAPNV